MRTERSEYAAVLASNQQDALDQYRVAQIQATTAERQLSGAQQHAAAQVGAVKSAETSVQQAQSQLQGTYAQVKGQLPTLVAQAQTAQEAQRERQAQLALAQQGAARQAHNSSRLRPLPRNRRRRPRSPRRSLL